MKKGGGGPYVQAGPAFSKGFIMDVKASNAYIPAAASDVYLRPAPLLQKASRPAAVLSPDDIIDCVEIRAGGHPPMHTEKGGFGYGASDKPQTTKGVLIDLWI
jgi:hypothetical protein